MKWTKNVVEIEHRSDEGAPEIADGRELPEKNYWQDRRCADLPYEGEDRRSGVDRRAQRVQAMHERRGSSLRFKLRRSNRLLSLFVLLVDAAALFIALLVPAFLLGMLESRATASSHYLSSASGFFLSVAVFFLAWNWLQGNYTKKCSLSDELSRFFKALFVAIGLQSIIAGFYGDRSVMLGLLMSWAVAALLVPFARILTKRLLFSLGLWTRPTVIVGTGVNAMATARAIKSDWLLGCHVVEFIHVPEPHRIASLHGERIEEHVPEYLEVDGRKIPVRQVETFNGRLFRSLGNPHIVVATDGLDFWGIVKVLYEQDVPYTTLDIAPSMAGIPIIGIAMSYVFRHDVLLMRVQNNLAHFMPQLVKRLFDIFCAAILLVMLSPLLIVVSVLVSLSGKNIIYGHERIGRNGKPFKCYKFRSMVNNSKEILEKLLKEDPEARAEWERDFKLKNDPRITGIGDFIRKTSIDELPQLINVIKGDMSLVGPRPVVADELERYQDKRSHYHMVRPGITGLWQISGRNDVSYGERVNLDSWYSRNWSLWHDLFILFRTLQVVINRSGAY